MLSNRLYILIIDYLHSIYILILINFWNNRLISDIILCYWWDWNNKRNYHKYYSMHFLNNLKRRIWIRMSTFQNYNRNMRSILIYRKRCSILSNINLNIVIQSRCSKVIKKWKRKHYKYLELFLKRGRRSEENMI